MGLRAQKASELYSSGRGSKIITSGGMGWITDGRDPKIVKQMIDDISRYIDDELTEEQIRKMTEAEFLTILLTKHYDVPIEDIYHEIHSLNTLDNIINTSILTSQEPYTFDRFIFVSGRRHINRVALTAKKNEERFNGAEMYFCPTETEIDYERRDPQETIRKELERLVKYSNPQKEDIYDAEVYVSDIGDKVRYIYRDVNIGREVESEEGEI